MGLRDWVMLPTAWVQNGGLRRLRWEPKRGADNIAALMALMVIAHHADAEAGVAKLTYKDFETATGLSRAKIAGGLRVLGELGVIEPGLFGRSTYRLAGYDRSAGWGKLPARRLYASGEVSAFSSFTMRHSAELHALKLYILFVARRDNDSNMAQISYDRITEYTGMERTHIRKGLNLLILHGLIHIEREVSTSNTHGISNGYRLSYIDSYNHLGTRGRRMGVVDLGSGMVE